MRQFFRAKEEYPEAILFFRLGDFYEMFFEDAVVAAKLLDITLTSRGVDEQGAPVPMAGVPHHAASHYVARLLELGQRVAICEQIGDPAKIKGIVPRQVVRVVTPGLVLDEDALDARAPNHLACVLAGEDGGVGLALLELSTLELRACRMDGTPALLAELVRLDPRELLLHAPLADVRADLGRMLPRVTVRDLDDAAVRDAMADAQAGTLAREATESGGLAPVAARACACVLRYAQRCQPGARVDVRRVVPYDPADQLRLDEAAIRNLELIRTLAGERAGSLLHLIDATETPMGARALRERLLAPLTDLGAIRRRHDAVEAFVGDATVRVAVRAAFARAGDMERLATRAVLGVATPRDLGALRNGLGAAARVAAILAEVGARGTDDTVARMVPDDVCDDMARRLAAALVDDPPALVNQGGVVRDGYDERVDELRELQRSAQGLVLELEARERERTGIASLKIRFTRVFGYYIEITRARLGAVPGDYRRKQTVAGGERFTTQALDDLQAKILNAEDRLRDLETLLFEGLRQEVGAEAHRLKRLAMRLGDIDVHAALADVAHRFGYARPELDDGAALELVEARHPVVERGVEAGTFVPNDVRLDADAARLMVLTGPNMAGKSTVMRQVALAVILAQAGSFVPARRARIGVVDRVYTRVGASDNLVRGQSTFMVEMQETASILRGATRRSLVILDEIGRGTSTYDGLAIAWAVAEHLHDVVGCRAMFATHYHELCDLARHHPGTVNFNVAAEQVGERIVFLRSLVPGGASRSYGVEVARLAGVPEIVLARARAILGALENESAPGRASSDAGPRHVPVDAGAGAQVGIFEATRGAPRASDVEATIGALDLDRMTPIEALIALGKLQAMLKRV
jgi:DNA mismatch repair protein MutS